MMELKEAPMDDSKRMTIEKSIRYKDENGKEVTKRLEVDEVSNGFIITISKSYYDKDDGYQYDSQKYISKTNPLKEKEEEKEEEKGDMMEEMIMSLNKMF